MRPYDHARFLTADGNKAHLNLGPVEEVGGASWGYGTLMRSPIYVNRQMLHLNAIQVIRRADMMWAANPRHDGDFDALQTLYSGHYWTIEQDGKDWVIFGVPAEA